MRVHELSIPDAPRHGVNPTTALALLSTITVVSLVTFFGAANAMLPELPPVEAVSEPSAGVPGLRSPDGTSVVALGAEDVAEAGGERVVVEGAGAAVAAPGDAAGAGGHGAGPAPRGPGRPGGRQGVGGSGGAGQAAPVDDHVLVRPGCSESDPLCGMETGGPLDV